MRNEPESNQRDIDYIKYPACYLNACYLNACYLNACYLNFALKEGENKPEKAKKWITHFLCIKIKPDHSGLGLKTIDGSTAAI